MKKLSLNESQLAQKLQLSRNAINAVMQWLKLPASEKQHLRSLKDPKEIRKHSRQWRKSTLSKKNK